MHSRLIAKVSIAALVGAQTAQAMPQSAPAAGQNSVPAPAHALTLPAGTVIPLTLINPIRSKSTKPGDTVRATVAFPVTTGSALAIPAGSYVEGLIQAVTARAKDTHQPAVQIHFTRLVFVNGYSAPLDGNSTQAELALPAGSAPETESAAAAAPPAPDVPGGSSFLAQQGQLPPLPPLPQVGPSPAVVGGALAGGTAVLTVLLVVLAHHSAARTDFLLFDAGWQFQMVLQSPLVLNADAVAAATTASTGN